MSGLVARSLFCAALALLSFGVTEARGERVIVALGDSLTAGSGVAADEAYPARLEARLQREGYAYRVVNAGVSGDTTAGGLRRVDWVLRAEPDIVIVALGANDGLRAPEPAGDARQPRGDRRAPAGRGRARPAGGHAAAAELRRGVHDGVPARYSRRSRRSARVALRAVSARRRRWPTPVSTSPTVFIPPPPGTR